jgi:hypothetical protein
MPTKPPQNSQIGAPRPIESMIVWARGQKVMLDSDLAQLYGVQTKALNQAVRRNRNRFPANLPSSSRKRKIRLCGHRL